MFGTTKSNGQTKFALFGKEAKQSIAEIKEVMSVMEDASKYFGESDSDLKLGALGSFLLGNGKKDYDVTKNLKTDVEALTSLFDELSKRPISLEKAMESVKQSFTVSDEFDEFAKKVDATGKSFDQLSGEYIPKYITNVTGATSVTTFFTGAITTLKAVMRQLLLSLAIGAAISLLIKGFQKLGEVIQDIKNPEIKIDEEISGLKDNVSNYTSDIDDLNQQLEETNERIKELSQGDVGTIVNQQEIEKLQLANIELENQIKLKEQLRQKEATELNNTVAKRADVNESVSIYRPEGANKKPASSYLTGGSSVASSSYGAALNNKDVNSGSGSSYEFTGTSIEALDELMKSYDLLKERQIELQKQFKNGSISEEEYTKQNEYLKKAMDDTAQSALDQASNVQELRDSLDENGDGYEEQSSAFDSAISKYVEWNEKSVQGLTDFERAYNDYNKSITAGDENAQKLKDAVTSGFVTEGSDAYKYATELAKKYNIEVQDLIASLKQMSGENVDGLDSINSRVSSVTESTQSLISSIDLVKEALNSQSTSMGVSQEAYDALIEADSDYASALEFSNGYMKINRELAQKITDTKTEEAKANIELAYSQNQMKYAQIKADMALLDEELENNSTLTEEQKSNIEEAKSALEEQSKAIRDNCKDLKMQYSALVQASSAYQDWLNAQNSAESGDMYEGTFEAKDAIKEGLTSGKIGTNKYKAAVDLLVPEDAQDDVAEYLKTINRYLQEDSEGNVIADGLNNFIKDSITSGLMSVNDDGSITMAANKTIQDYADALHLTPDMVQSIFGALQDYGWNIDWEEQLGNQIDNLRMKIDDLHDQMDDLGPGAEGTEEWNALNEQAQKYQEQLDSLYEEQSTRDPVQVAIDLSDAQNNLEQITQELSTKGQLSVVDIQNLTDAQQKVEELEQQKEKLGDPTPVEIQAYVDSASEEEAKRRIEKLTQAGILSLDTGDASTGTDKVEKQVQAIKDASGHIVMNLDTKQAQSNIDSVKKAIDNIPKQKSMVINISTRGSLAGLFGFGVSAKSSSTNKASAAGGVSTGGKTLVGELGNEIVVNPKTGKWYTVGDHGAEFVDLPKDAIVFDHEKTKDLLGQGFISGRGQAYAGGTALASGLPNYGISGGGGYIVGQNPATTKTYTGATKSNTSAVKANTDAVEANKEALEAQKEALEKQKEAYEKESNALKIYGQAAINEIDKRIDAINKEKAAQQKAYQDQIKQLQEYQKQQDKAYEKQIDALEDKKKALQKANDEEDRAIKLAELQDELARAQSQKTVRIYNENEGFVWRADQEAVDEAQGNLDDQQREWKNEDAINAIDEEIEKINDLKDAFDESIEDQIAGLEARQEAMEESFDSEIDNLENVKEQWNDAMGLIGTSWEDYQLQLAAAAEFNGMTLEQMAAGVGAYKDNVIANMQAIGETSAEIDRVTEAINALESAAGGGSSGGGGGDEASGIEGSGTEEIGDFSGGTGIANLSAQLQEAGGVSEETANKLQELHDKIVEVGDANLSLKDREAELIASSVDLNASFAERSDAMLQLGLVQSQIADNQAILTDLSAQYIEALGSETEATDEARQTATDSLTDLSDKYGVSYEDIFSKLDEYIQKLSDTGVASNEELTSLAAVIQMFSDSATTSINSVGSGFDDAGAKANAMADTIVAATNRAIAAINALKAAQNSVSGSVGHASGILNSPTSHFAYTDEQGPEIKIRPMSGNYSFIERGDTVIPHAPSENLWKFGLNPDAFIAQHIQQRTMPKIEISQQNDKGISMGDVKIEMYGVNDVESFGSVLAQKAPTIIAQTFAKRN